MNKAADFVVRDDGTWGPQYAAPIPKLRFVSGASLAGTEPPPRPWHVPGLIPGKTVSLITGDGGTGKTLLALQLAAATATATSWIGYMPEPGTTLFISAEDDLDELHRRLVDVAAGQGLMLEDLASLHILSLAGQDAVLASPAGRSDTLEPSPLFHAIEDAVERFRPTLVIFDPLADLFAGNEIVRSQARQFIALLRGLAMRAGAAIVLLAHPSQSGINSGTGTSGSTAWNNSVRSRLYFERPKAEADSIPDPDVRVLRLMKANYASTDVSIPLRWKDGLFVLDDGSRTTFAATPDEVDRRFLDLLARLDREGRHVTSTRCPTHAPSVFAQQPDAAGIKKRAFEDAMNRLFSAGAIKLVSEGPPSRRRSRIVLT